MKERGKIFNTEDVKAILEGRKTMFRVPVKTVRIKNPIKFMKENSYRYPENSWLACDRVFAENINCPFGQIGDRIYVRETFILDSQTDKIVFKAGIEDPLKDALYWKPSILMPKKYARLWLEIIDIRVERVQDITQEDAQKEGFECTGWRPTYNDPDSGGDGDSRTPIDNFFETWENTHWSENPWVFVYKFKLEEK